MMRVVLSVSAMALWAAGMLAADAQEIGQPAAGKAYAQRACAECHAVEAGRPSPMGGAPSFETIAAVPGMSSTALTVALQSSHRTMPNVIIEAGDARNVIAYILSLKP